MVKNSLEFKIILAVGYPDEPLTREEEHFKRKDIMEIANNTSPVSMAMRLAPSGMNLQPWYLYKDISSNSSVDNVDGRYHMYCVSRHLFSSMHMTDVGIALAHIFVYANMNNLNIKFSDMEHSKIPGRKYIISAEISS